VVVWQGESPTIYGQDQLEELADHLEAAPVVLSFNGVGFDIPFIEGCLGRRLDLKHHLDLLQLVWDAIAGKKKGNTLGELSRRTLGITKSGSGVMAPELSSRGQWAQLHSYCIQDVSLTRQLFQYAQIHGGVIGANGALLRLNLPSWFEEIRI
jgi:DEAD/DEAH box helicase domain-containing protein